MAAKKKARSNVMTLKLSSEERRLFQRVADRYGITVSAMLRMLVKKDSDGSQSS